MRCMNARSVVALAAERGGFDADEIVRLFGSAPLDFPVIFRRHLPLYVDLNGMRGITIFQRVWLLDRVVDAAPIDLIGLIRHEAEHVAQQRTNPLLFYPRYLVDWLLGYLRKNRHGTLAALRRRFGRAHAAYRFIPDERRAYAAGLRLEARIRRAYL